MSTISFEINTDTSRVTTVPKNGGIFNDPAIVELIEETLFAYHIEQAAKIPGSILSAQDFFASLGGSSR